MTSAIKEVSNVRDTDTNITKNGNGNGNGNGSGSGNGDGNGDGVTNWKNNVVRPYNIIKNKQIHKPHYDEI